MWTRKWRGWTESVEAFKTALDTIFSIKSTAQYSSTDQYRVPRHTDNGFRQIQTILVDTETESESHSKSRSFIPSFVAGGYHYLEVRKPGVIEELPEKATTIPRRELTTGNGKSPEGYMKLGISQYQTVDHIVCLSQKGVSTDHMISLYEVHQRVLNNMLSRYDEGLIKDFYQYFNESWCLAIFHDRFPDFRDEIRQLLTTSPGPGMESIERKVREVIDDDLGLWSGHRRVLEEVLQASGTKRALETRLFSFLAYNYYHLPMYAKPGML